MAATATATHRYIGVTDEQTVCDHCGKAELAKTIVLALLDADGNQETVVHYGSTCAARALAVKGGARRVRDLAGFAHRQTVEAAADARALLAFYGVEGDGTITHRFGFDGVAMDYEVKHRDHHWAQVRSDFGDPVRPAEWRQMAREFIERRTAQVREAALIGG